MRLLRNSRSVPALCLRVKHALNGVRVALAGDALHSARARANEQLARPAALLQELLHGNLVRHNENAPGVHAQVQIGLERENLGRQSDIRCL